MEVREAPTVHHWPVLATDDGDRFGQFVVISLDRAQSVAPLEDPLVLEDALKLPNDRYLAIALGTGFINHFVDTGEFKLNCEFYLVRQGLPKGVQTECVPIAAASQHPTGRSALYPTAPLPWDDLYVLTFSGFYAVVSRIHCGTNPSPARLTRDMMLQLRNARHEDLRAYDSKPEPRPTQPVPAPAPAPAPVSAPVPVIPLPPPAARDDQSSSGDGSLYASETESEPSQLDPVEEALQVIARKVTSVKNYVEIWLDLEQAGPDLHDPEALKPVLKNLRGILVNWRTRSVAEVLGKNTETDAWLQGVTDPLSVDIPPSRPEDGCEEGSEDDAVRPEDARDDDDDREASHIHSPGSLEVPSATKPASSIAAHGPGNDYPTSLEAPAPPSPTTSSAKRKGFQSFIFNRMAVGIHSLVGRILRTLQALPAKLMRAS